MAFDLTSLLPIVGNVFDAFQDNSRYNDAAGMTREQLELQRDLLNKSSEWQTGNNKDLLDYILGINPQAEAETAGVNAGNAGFANNLNRLRSGFANDLNDLLGDNADTARGVATNNYGATADVAGAQMGIGDDILDTAFGRDPSRYIDAAGQMTDDMLDSPYSLEDMEANATEAAMLGLDREYKRAGENVARSAVRQGTGSNQKLLDLSSQAARDTAETLAGIRLNTPKAFEDVMATRRGSLGGATSILENIAGGIDSRKMAGGASAANVLGGAADTLSGGARLGIDTLLHKPDFEDPSAGMYNPLERFQSVMDKRINPFAAQTNPFSGLKPAIPAMPRAEASDLGATIGTGLSELFRRK